MKTPQYWIENLNLQQHPEGGWFKEIYRDLELINVFAQNTIKPVLRNASTSIYYLLEDNDFSAFHKIKSDEVWHFYTGNSAIEIRWIENETLHKKVLGNNPESGENFQVVVPKNCWFAASVVNKTGFVLAGCTVAPGFDFADFEMADLSLAKQFPELKNEILPFIRK